ncbi:MAG TPA: hypothetical protein VKD71_06390 [Gemmataceae bacterium]|nr:hypothetical protein [Gemmataceae bacterium]
MVSYKADEVGVPDDSALAHGEGWLFFGWADPVYGREGLTIDLDGHCSRRMPIRSGQGPPDFMDLQRDRIRLRFDPALARNLEFDEEIEITFAVSDANYSQLRKVFNLFNGVDP